jgi:5S rRNA maturation endonuclease (ribonuclease M5)
MSSGKLLERLKASSSNPDSEGRSHTYDLVTEFHSAYPGAKRVAKNEFRILCHKHDDTNPSLSVNVVKGVWHCFSCGAKGKLTSLPGLRHLRHVTAARGAEAEYVYTDPDGRPVCRKLRYPGKIFVWQRFENERWIKGLGGFKLPYLYNLPAVLKSRTVVLVEGEKDADNVIQAGYVATTPPYGAKNWRPEFSEALRDKSLVIIPDNDRPGYQHAVELIKQLWNVAISIDVAIIQGDDGTDVSDLLGRDNGVEELKALIRRAKPVGQGATVFEIQDFVDLALRDPEFPTRHQRISVASVINSFRSREQSEICFSQRRLADELDFSPGEVGEGLHQAERLGYWSIQGTEVGTRLTIRWEDLGARWLRVLPLGDVATREIK